LKNQTSSEIDTPHNDNSKLEEQCTDRGEAIPEIDEMTGTLLEERSLQYSLSDSLTSQQDTVNSNQPINDVDTQKIKTTIQKWSEIFKTKSSRERESKDTQKFHQIKLRPMESSNLQTWKRFCFTTSTESKRRRIGIKY
jgi:hypothetical protein